ncbi:nicotinate phosphoribosyltransferase [Aulographum hederae CBS 113979]|uniref:nicotinate phosphoribosyltransferase n=1 Tax=Aulographum hederae CBS 113979 TaxID=1176131 RepID=A0A6G1GP15_9PEZI|nr:nicotinate phosphoribosyltransferase [Aulographum hederae CBS 113979]
MELPEGIFSLLDTDLYKLTMQCCVLKYFPDTRVTYRFTNRTPDMRLSRAAVQWLQAQINKLENIAVTDEELEFLNKTCSYFSEPYLKYLKSFRLRPSTQIKVSFTPIDDTGSEDDCGDLYIHTEGLWVETILYEIPLLALISEAYFKFIDRDWTHDGQKEKAAAKGLELLQNGCIFSEFGSRRRRDYHTHDLVVKGLLEVQEEAKRQGYSGKLAGTSNVHFAMKHGIPPVGTVAHEWFMGVAAITNRYEDANELALQYWVGTFGEGVLGIALTDTFGTDAFLQAFKKPMPKHAIAASGAAASSASAASTMIVPGPTSLSETSPAPLKAPVHDQDTKTHTPPRTYAETFTGVRQDSGDPVGFVSKMRNFYDSQSITDKKTIVFSDSLNIELCLKYKTAAENHGFQPSFGVGTFFTNDFVRSSTGKKSVPLNIVIKIASAEGRPAVKISDNIGKNTGDEATVAEVKRRLGYEEREWAEGDESRRWGKDGDQAK